MNRKKVKDPDHGTIMICAMRYALGRETYMPGIVQDYIRAHKDELDLNTVTVMLRDIEDHNRITEHKLSNGKVLKIDGLGDTKIDRPGWIVFREWLKDLEAELRILEEKRQK